MLSSGKVVRGIQGRLQHAGNAAVIARRAGQRRTAAKRSAALLFPGLGRGSTMGTSSTIRTAGYSTTAPAERAVVNGKAVPLADEIVHERFLACVEKGDAHSAMAHFAFISCEARERGAETAPHGAEGERREAGELLTLRRRQLLVLLCEKGMVKEASELLANAVASPAFDSRDSSTIASFMYVVCGCLSHNDVDRALLHFRQASERGIGLALPVCESLATALFVKGLQGQGTEEEAWNVLDYIRQRGMVHRPEVCEQALLWALASQDLSFALRMCEHVDDEGMVLDHDVRDMAFRKVGSAIDQLPYTAAFNVNAGVDVGTDDDTDDAATTPFGAAAGAQAVGAGGDSEDAIDGDGDVGEWKVEGTNATVSQLWELQRLLQSWLDTEMDEFDDDEDDDDDDDDEEGETQEFEISVGEIDEEADGEDGLEASADNFVDAYPDDDTPMAVEEEEVSGDWAADVVDFEYDNDDDDDDDDDNNAGGATGGEKASAASPQALSEEAAQDGDGGERDGKPGWPYSAPDFAGAEYCGDLMDQMSELHPDQHIAFRADGEDFEFPGDGGYLRGGSAAGQFGGGGGGGSSSSLSRRSVMADLVMPYEDPQGEGGQGVVSIPIKISVQETDDDDDEDD